MMKRHPPIVPVILCVVRPAKQWTETPQYSCIAEPTDFYTPEGL